MQPQQLNSQTPADISTDKDWLALMIGNSRLHWAAFKGKALQQTWNSPHLTEVPLKIPAPPDLAIAPEPEILLASVVPEQTALWQAYPAIRQVGLEDIPVQGLYSTMGIDRVLAVWGAGETLGWPVLVIDAGTALTFTGADAEKRLVGGAILPGLGLQIQTLATGTAALPLVERASLEALASRWAANTPDAIRSGVIYTLLAGIQAFVADWKRQFPGSAIAFTGGDSPLLLAYLQQLAPDVASQITADPHLIFWGMRSHYLALNES